MIKRLLAIGVVTACGAGASDWQATRRVEFQIQETNFLLRQASQEQRYQNYLQQVAYYAEHHPDSPPPRPVLSGDPRDFQHNIWLLDQYVEFARKWDEGQIQNESSSAAQDLENLPAKYRGTWQNLTAPPALSEAELDAKFQEQIAESRAKRDRVYPEALEPNHPIHEEAEKIWKNIEETGHALLSDPDAPFKVYEMAALRLGIKPTGQP